MAALADQVWAYARAQQVDRSGPRGGVQAWSIVEATTVTGRDALRAEFPGAGEDAAINVHKGLSVGCGAPVRDHVRPARDHDSRPLTMDASWRGDGLLADLASASRERLRAGETHGGRCVMRLKAHGTPKVDDGARGQITPAFFPGAACDARLEEDTLVLDGRAIDADGPIGRGRHAVPRRLVGVQSPQGSWVFLTTLPPRIGPRQVADR
jgi:hypothetical protein